MIEVNNACTRYQLVQASSACRNNLGLNLGVISRGMAERLLITFYVFLFCLGWIQRLPVMCGRFGSDIPY
jgi:hypothetical protein